MKCPIEKMIFVSLMSVTLSAALSAAPSALADASDPTLQELGSMSIEDLMNVRLSVTSFFDDRDLDVGSSVS